jgi:hypothetical protein
MTKPTWSNAEAAEFLGVPVDDVVVVAGASGAAIVKDGELVVSWDSLVLRNWAKGIGVVAARFGPRVKGGSGGRVVGQ